MGNASGKEEVDTEPLESLKGLHSGGINCMALSEDASLLVTGSDDATLRLWSTKTESTEELGELKGHEGFIQCAIIVDTYVVTGSKDHTVRLWDLASLECLFIYPGHTGRINHLLCTGEFIFSTSHDKTARAWLFDTKKVDKNHPEDSCIKVFTGHSAVVSPILFVPGIALGEPDEQGYNINPGDLVITGSFDNTARSWSFDTGGCLKTFKGHHLPITCMATDPQGQILYTGGQDKVIIAWNLKTGSIMKKVNEAHTGAVLHLRVENRLMYSCGTDHTARRWVREGLENTRIYKNHTDTVVAAKFHNGILYTACNDGDVRAFDATSGTLKRTFRGHESAVTCLTVCVNKHEDQIVTRVISGSNDGTIKIWNATGISDEPPELPLGERDYESEQKTRLHDLERRLSDYFPTIATNTPVASPPPNLNIIEDVGE